MTVWFLSAPDDLDSIPMRYTRCAVGVKTNNPCSPVEEFTHTNNECERIRLELLLVTVKIGSVTSER